MEEGSTTKKSRKGLIIGLVALMLIAAGAAAYFLTKDDNQANNTASSNNTSQTPSQTTSTFEPQATANEPFVATVNTTVNGKDVKGIMTSDGQGNASYAYTTDGNKITLTYTKDAYYICNDNAGCFKYNVSGENNSGFDPSDYQYDSSKLADLKNNANYKGQQPCPAPATGTCDVWSVSMGSVTSTMYVNTATKRIAKVTSANGTTTSDITYEYKKATVAIPQNATTLPSGQ
jgi:hypothetical protein